MYEVPFYSQHASKYISLLKTISGVYPIVVCTYRLLQFNYIAILFVKLIIHLYIARDLQPPNQ